MRRAATVLVMLAGTFFGARTAHAHQPSEGFIIVTPSEPTAGSTAIEVRWDLALRDLDRALGLDADHDGTLHARELDAATPRILAFVRAGLSLATTAPCALEPAVAGVTSRLDGMHLSLALTGTCPAPLVADGASAEISVKQAALFAMDPSHRALVRVGVASAVLRADAPEARLRLTEAPDALATLGLYVKEGVLHIWEGIDHVFFLLALLLPAVLRWRRDPDGIQRWQAAERLRPVMKEVLKVVTAFTVAHSLTLVLSALGLVRMPVVITETAIAISVALAALNNLRPIVDARWTVAFGLGLLHGFGFSSVLMELGLPDTARALALFGFNVGVELGQAAIVLAVIPLAFAVRRYPFYRYGVLLAGSIAIAGVALYWTAQRLGL